MYITQQQFELFHISRYTILLHHLILHKNSRTLFQLTNITFTCAPPLHSRCAMPSLFDTGRPNSTNSTDAADPSSSAGTPASRQAQPANCRTCTDFKSWAKQQRSGLLNTSSATGERQASTFAASTPPAAPPTTATTATTTAAVPPTAAEPDGTNPRGCPYDKDDLGNATWGLLHTIAAHYPDKPTREEAKDMSTFFTVLSKFYPCETCAKDFREE